MDRNALMTIHELGLLDLFYFLEVRHCKIYHCTRENLRLFRVYIERKRNPDEITDYFVCTANLHA